MNAITMLKTQHAEVESLFQKLEHERDEADRADLIGRVIDRLTMHAALEEEIFYPAVADLPGGRGPIEHARNEHRKVDQLLDALRASHFTDAAATETLAELRRTVEHHVAEEERRLLPMAERLGMTALRDLAREMEERIDVGQITMLRAAGARR
jgi:hemerythrin superfamily protein